MLHGLERFVVPATYGIGVLLWAVVLGVLLARLRRPPDVNRLFFVLVVVLAIDAFRTLFENAYFGAYWNAVYGILPSQLKVLLEAPTLVVLPRLVNLFAGGLILFLVLWRWLPAAESDRIDLASRLADAARDAERARDRYRRIVDASPDLVLALDDSGHVTDAGAQFREVLGLDPSELPGKPLSALIVPSARAAFEARLGGMLMQGSFATDTIETVMLHGDGREVPVSMRFARVADGGVLRRRPRPDGGAGSQSPRSRGLPSRRHGGHHRVSNGRPAKASDRLRERRLHAPDRLRRFRDGGSYAGRTAARPRYGSGGSGAAPQGVGRRKIHHGAVAALRP